MPAGVKTISDELIVLLDEGSSLRRMLASGALQRQMLLWQRLGRHHGAMRIVSHGGADDARIAADLGVPCVCNHTGLLAHEHEDHAPRRVAANHREGGSATILATNPMTGRMAVALSAALADAGVRTGLVAVAGDLWSRQSLYEFGPTSRAAREAAIREQLACTAAQVVLAGSRSVADHLTWRFNLPGDRVRVVPGFIDPGTTPRTAGERDAGEVVALGPATRRRRLHLVVAAMAELARQGCDGVALTVLGDGPEAQELRTQADSLGVELAIEASPGEGERAAAVARAAVVVSAATHELHPGWVFDAMAAAAPVLLACDPDCAADVVHGVSGLRMPPTPEAIAQGLFGLLGDAPWRDELGRSARAAVVAAHGLDRVADLILDAQRAALCAKGRLPGPVAAPMILTADGLALLTAEEAGAAWTEAIADHLRRCGASGAGHLEAIRRRLATLEPPKPTDLSCELPAA